jgi:hypothetical protein
LPCFCATNLLCRCPKLNVFVAPIMIWSLFTCNIYFIDVSHYTYFILSSPHQSIHLNLHAIVQNFKSFHSLWLVQTSHIINMSSYPIKLDRLTNGSLVSQGIQIEVLVGFVRIIITTIPTIDFIDISLLTSLPCFSATDLLCRWLRITLSYTPSMFHVISGYSLLFMGPKIHQARRHYQTC